MTTLVHVVRHGATESNLARRYMGRSEEPLAAEGRWQARQAARRLRDLPLAAVYCSPLRRAAETAGILARGHRLEPLLEPDFVEIDVSRWQGKTAAEIAADEPDLWRSWCDEPSRLRVEGIEPLVEVRQRVGRGLRRVVARHPGAELAVVTHDIVVRMAMLEALGLPDTLYRSLPSDNASLTTLELGGRRNRLLRFNDVAHLDGAVAPRSPADD